MNFRLGILQRHNAAWLDENRTSQIDLSIIGGIVISFSLLLVCVIFSGNGSRFFSLSGLAIVLGGTFGATLVNFSFQDISKSFTTFFNSISYSVANPIERIAYLVDTAQAVRHHGLLVLDREARIQEDPFLKMAFEVTVDGQKNHDIKRMLENDINCSSMHAQRSIKVFETMGGFAPAMGLIGTLIGLIQMLGNLDNPATVGPAMSIALTTTLYGAILANLLFLPIAGKLKNRSEEENLVKSITLEGTLSLASQENPIVIEQKLQSFLPRKDGNA